MAKPSISLEIINHSLSNHPKSTKPIKITKTLLLTKPMSDFHFNNEISWHTSWSTDTSLRAGNVLVHWKSVGRGSREEDSWEKKRQKMSWEKSKTKKCNEKKSILKGLSNGWGKWKTEEWGGGWTWLKLGLQAQPSSELDELMMDWADEYLSRVHITKYTQQGHLGLIPPVQVVRCLLANVQIAQTLKFVVFKNVGRENRLQNSCKRNWLRKKTELGFITL